MPLLPKQIRVRDLILGPGTPYDVMTGTDFFRSSSHSTGGGDRAWADGTWAGAEFADERTISISVLVRGSSMQETMTNWWALKKAFRPIGFGTEVPVHFFYDQEYMVMGRPRLVEPDMDNVERGHIFVTAGITATNPTIYAAEPNTVTGIILPTWIGGTELPFTPPFTLDGEQLGGSGVIENTGTDTTGFLFQINGPVDNPRITVENEEGTFHIRCNFNLADTDFCLIDTSKRTVLMNGTASARGQVILSPSGKFPVAPPGESTIFFNGSSLEPGASLDVTVYSAYN